MTVFPLCRLALLAPILFIVSRLIFGLPQPLPGDPALAGEERSPFSDRVSR
jgi:ABC-type dipeptide/oligopeptide/nickel transport system permease component